MNTERKPGYYRKLYEKETGKVAEAPTYLDEPRYFNPSYVEWLEKKLAETPITPETSRQVSRGEMIEMAKSYFANNLMDGTGDKPLVEFMADFAMSLVPITPPRQVSDEEIIKTIEEHTGFSAEELTFHFKEKTGLRIRLVDCIDAMRSLLTDTATKEKGGSE